MSGPDREASSDVREEIDGGIARITIDRPEVREAFRAETCDALVGAVEAAAAAPEGGTAVLAGALRAAGFSPFRRGDTGGQPR